MAPVTTGSTDAFAVAIAVSTPSCALIPPKQDEGNANDGHGDGNERRQRSARAVRRRLGNERQGKVVRSKG